MLNSFSIPVDIFYKGINSLTNYIHLSPQEVKSIRSIEKLINDFPTYTKRLFFDEADRGKWVVSNPTSDYNVFFPEEQGEFFSCWFQFYNSREFGSYAKEFRGSTIKNCLYNLREKILPYEAWRTLNSFEDESVYAIYNEGTGSYTIISLNHRKVYKCISIPNKFIYMLSNDLPTTTKLMKSNNNNKENDTIMKMPTMMKNFDFGPVTSGVQMSPCGLAIQKGEQWLSYNPTTGQTVDVTGITFDFPSMIFKMPVATNAIQKGDIIVHQRHPMFVTDIVGTKVEAVDIMASEEKIIIPVTDIFGFNFITKIVPLMNINGMAPSPENPFGNIMPLMAMSMVFGSEDETGANETVFGGMDMRKMIMVMAIMSMFNPNSAVNPFGQMFNFGGMLSAATATSMPSTTEVKTTTTSEDND